MSSFTYPGVYIEELPSGQHTITGVATSIGAFIGWAPQGPVTAATLVQSWSDYQTLFGGLDARSWLGYAVNQFFANGGNQCYIIRLVWDGSITTGVNNPVPCETALAAGIGYGTATISAAYSGLTGAITLGVGTPVLQTISVLPAGMTAPAKGPMPALPPLPFGASLALGATANQSDGSTPPVSAATWVSSDTSVLTVSPSGVVTAGTTAGTATVSAVSGVITGSIAVTVTPATITSIAVTPATITAFVGQTAQLSATAKYSDGTAPDITAIAAWSSSSAAAVPAAPGQFIAKSAGAPTITAGLPAAWTITGSPTGSSTLTITDPVVALVITPANGTVPLSLIGPETDPGSFTAASVLSDGTPGPAPTVAWNSSNTGVATVNSTTGALAIIGVGTTTISASYTPTGQSTPVSASTQFTVSSGHLTGLNVSPPTLTLASGLSQQLTAIGTFDNGTFVDLTGCATWTSSAAAATVSATGLVTAAKLLTANATVTITADWMNVNATTTVTATPPIPESIAITTSPTGTTSIPPGTSLSLVATATMSDKTTAVVTAPATWASSNSALISITGPGVVAAAASGGGSLTLFASNPGIWGNNLRVSVGVQPPPNSTRFSLLVQQLTPTGQLKTLESYVNLSVLSTDPNYVVTLVNNDSNYITFTNPATGSNVLPSAPPAATTAPIAFTGGADGTVLVPTDQNFELALTFSATAGFNLLDRVDIFNLLCVPGETDGAVISKLQAYCALKRAFMIVDSPQYATISGLIQSGPIGSDGTSITGDNSPNSALYFPWILAPDPLVGNRPALFPPCGFVAGIYAATDSSRGVWKAPAGVNASLTGNSGLQYVLTDLENGSLNIQAVNCLRQFKVYGDIVWGARTLAGNDQAGSQWKYVPIRRLALFLESSLFDGTQWVVFEPNDETLWGQIRMNVGTFLQGLFLQGAFAGTTPQQAYFVKCDAENNPPASVALGVVNILVGFAPLYPAEFVVIQIQQIIAQAS